MDKNPVETFPAQFHRMSHKICDTICKSGIYFGIFHEKSCAMIISKMFADRCNLLYPVADESVKNNSSLQN